MACGTFNDLPDALLLLILDRLADAKTIACCTAVSLRLRSLLCHVHNVVLKPDHTPYSHTNTFSRLCGRILKKPNPTVENDTADHYSHATQLKNFDGVKYLKIELPSPELGLENGSLLKWSATFGSTFNNCVVLGATSMVRADPHVTNYKDDISDESRERNSPLSLDESIIPESFFTNGDLKSRVVWTISSLIAASARHYSAEPIIKQHKTLQSLVMNDACGQGVLRMNREQLEEVWAMQTSDIHFGGKYKREIAPDLQMRMWYLGRVEMWDGSVLTGVTLGAILPMGKMASNEGFLDEDWVVKAFEEPFASVAKVLMRGRSYKVDMGSF